MSNAKASAAGNGRLAKNSVGLSHIVFFVVAAAAPLTAVVGSTPASFAFGNGAGLPGNYILAGLLYLVFSVGFTAMSRYVVGAGGFYTYITAGLGKPAGVAGALMALATYTSVQVAIYALLGVFVAVAMQPFGITAPWWVWTFASLLIVAICGQRNIEFSGKILGICMLAEIAILLLLSVGILLAGGGPEGIGFTSFAPSSVFAPGLGAGLVFVIGSYIGFEATAIFGEEAENPERTIPRATYVAVLLITVLYAFATWAIVQYYGPSKVQEIAKGNLEGFYFTATDAVLGTWASNVMNILLITSLFACVLSFHNTLNRYFFALGREGLVSTHLGKVHEVHGSPHVAGMVQSISAAAILSIFIVAGSDPYAVVFSWMGAFTSVAILMVQLLVSLAVIFFFRKNAAGNHSVWTTTIAPALSLVGLAGALYLVVDNLSLLTGSESPIVMAFPYLVLAIGVFGAAFAMRIRSTKPELYAALGKAFV